MFAMDAITPNKSHDKYLVRLIMPKTKKTTPYLMVWAHLG